MSSIPPRPFPSSKQILKEVEKLQRAIQRGSLDQRENLVKKMGELAVAYTSEGRFDNALKTWDEAIELTETLFTEGKLEIVPVLVSVILPINITGHEYHQQHGGRSGFNEDAYFQRLMKCITMLSEEAYLCIKNECALEIHKRAESLRKNEAHIAAIALLDESLRMIEPHFDPNTTRFTDWKSLLDIYRSRGQWKCEIGDTESGIADLLHFENMAEQALALLQCNMAESRQRTGNTTIRDDGKIIVRLYAEDCIDFVFAYHFHEDRYDAILDLANAYYARAEKEKALEYFDKALAIAQDDQDTHANTRSKNSRLSYFSASMDVPYRKGFLLAQYHQFEDALEQYDLAIQNVKTLLQSKRQEFFEALESRFNEISRARADVLQNLGRYDEAKDAVELAKQRFTKMVEPEKVRSDNPLLMKNLFASPGKKAKNPLGKVFQDGEKFDEKKAFLQFGALHNEAMMDFQRGQIEMHAGNWRKALRFMLKARFVIDSPAMLSFPEAKKNLFGIYASIAGIYLSLKEYEKSQLWYERAVRHAQSLIDDGDDSDLRSQLCIVRQGLGESYSRQGQHEKSLTEFSTAFAQRAQVIEELEASLEGLDRERIRVHDNQKLMPLAVLYQAQVASIRMIENQIFAMNAPGAAESWARIEMETFEKFRALLLKPKQADGDYSKTVASCVAMLRWGGQEEKGIALLEQWIAGQHHPFETEEEARTFIHVEMAIRLKELYALTDLSDGDQLFQQIAKLVNQERFPEAYQAVRVLRALLVHRQGQHHDAPPYLRDFYQVIIAHVDKQAQALKDEHSVDDAESDFEYHPYAPDEIREILDRMEEEEDAENADDEPDEDENAALYERDFETASDNHAMLFKMLDAFSGKNTADKLIEEYDRHKGRSVHKAGRNDPCPCGSGKKYKKCCMEK